MKKLYFKITAELIGLQLFFALASVMFVSFFSWMQGWKWIFSFFTGWLFLGAAHSTLWQLGNKDRKNNIIVNKNLPEGAPDVKLSIWGGLKYASAFFAINVIVVLLVILCDNGGTPGNTYIYLVHRILMAPLFGFLPEYGSGTYALVSLLLCVVMYIPCITAYISGTKNFSLTEIIVPRLIYKNKENE